jgi:hypothetical protein
MNYRMNTALVDAVTVPVSIFQLKSGRYRSQLRICSAFVE